MTDYEIIKKRLIELSHRSYERGYNTFSDFLSLDEISTLKSLSIDSKYIVFGGYENAERCVAGFGDDVNRYEFPIVCIRIEPLQQKFADKLTHRDFLGSLMNLGISRSTLGDIIIKSNVGYLFCLDTISQYICDNLSRIKHTTVKCTACDEAPDFITTLPDVQEIIASSCRSDAVICAIYKISRKQATQLFSQEKVYINSKVAGKESTILKNNDIVSVRGFGKFIFCGIERETKKGREIISVRVYK